MPRPLVAIVGRPNVGKSTLFNRLVGKRISIVDDTPGVTRDRLIGLCEWRGKKISVVDTGGLDFTEEQTITANILDQTYTAINLADVVVLVVNIRDGLIASDREAADIVKKSKKPAVLCVNKCDYLGEPVAEFYEFYSLGLGDPVEVSSIHGHGTGDLLDAVYNKLPDFDEENEEDEILNVAVIGKPNVGKSSLINKISGDQRCIVSDIAGTTRDNVDVEISNKFGKYNLVDTAGLRRKSKVFDSVEKYSVIRSKLAISRSDVCVVMLDALEEISEQDVRIAGFAHEAGRGCVIAVNKWDFVEKTDKTMSKYKEKIRNKFKFMSYAPIIFISAKTGQRIDRLFELINFVSNSCTYRISTGTLNGIVNDAMARSQPPIDKGKRLKIYYAVQVSVKPPTFVFFVNISKLFHFSYQRYIENCIRNTFGLEGTPIHFVIREKSKRLVSNIV